MKKSTHIIVAKTVPERLSNNFMSTELHCKCTIDSCVSSPIDLELIEILQDIRNQLGPVTVTSGHRCHPHNKNVKGSKLSQHVNGSAADIRVSQRTPQQVYDYLDNKYPNRLGLGLYKTWVHVDTRQTKARWSK